MARMRISLFVVVGIIALLGGGVRVAAAAGAQTKHPAVTISSDSEFTAANGVRSGNGTRAHPYVISGWLLPNLTIQNTGKWVTIRDNSISGRLVLDWIGPNLLMQHNVVNDLRVNQNVTRTGHMTSGVITHNTFTVLGQLRHWDGLFAYNTVGDKNNLGSRAVNFDGFNGAHFVHNTIYGYMDAKLHGHHHSHGWGEPSHEHATTTPEQEIASHRYRYHEVTIADNTIHSTNSYALAYLDTNHSGDDRQSNSENDPNLNVPHVHYTKVHITGNRLEGAGILINVFNAADNLHPWYGHGYVDIADNKISLAKDDFLSFKQLNGIEVDQAQDVSVRITGNTITAWRTNSDDMLSFLESMDNDAGVLLNTLDDADVWIAQNSVTNRVNGVRATQMTALVHWTIRHLTTHGVDHQVSYDGSVANKPS
jgi:hypothetical protein